MDPFSYNSYQLALNEELMPNIKDHPPYMEPNGSPGDGEFAENGVQNMCGRRRNRQNCAGSNGQKFASVTSHSEEALKNEISFMPMKTPVSILQELLSRRGITPTYELVQIEGAIHEPTFRYRVSFNDKDIPFTAMGAGRSKKEAKHAAAKSVIDKMTGIITTEIPAGSTLANVSQPIAMSARNRPPSPEIGLVTVTNSSPVSNDETIMGNPIGWLQELCMARRWPPPTYETEMEVGLPHERQFTIACIVLKYHEIGQGKSKKIAKRLAAQKMWNRLQDNPHDSSQIAQMLDEEGNEEINQRVTNILNRYNDLKDAHVPTLTNQHSYKVSQFHKTLKTTFGKLLNTLQVSCLNDANFNYVQFLQEIAIEQAFEITYVDIDEISYNGLFQCLVQLSTLPVAVCQGTGTSAKEAQINAAHNALEYLKIMTKK